MSFTANMKDLLEAGVHYGHQTKRWNPRMAPYIYGARNGIHIIDLQKTVKMFQKATDYLEHVTSQGGHVLFVGTKRLARSLVKEQAERCGMYYINHRWLGGTLTNYQTIRQSIHRLKKIERMSVDGTFQKLTKKEVLGLNREKEKLELALGGIKDMPGLPSAIFVIDAQKENISVLEANKLGIPVVAVTDTNADPSDVDFVVPGNDDSIKAISLFTSGAAEACLSGKRRAKDRRNEDTKEGHVKEGSFLDDHGHKVEIEKR